MKTIAMRSLAEAFTRASLMKIVCGTLGWTLAMSDLTQRTAAQGESTATIAGRVSNETSGQYLQRARISIPGTSIETFTDDLGNYSLSNVPAGQVTLSVFYTGLEQQTASVRVPSTGVVRQDFNLTRTTAESGVVKLEAFTVAESREYNARAIALNEQRFAGNLKNVVSTDEFGDIGESNLGEFIKFMPGVSVGYSVGVMATGVSVRGFPSHTTLISMDGGEMASSGVGAPNRQLDLWAVPVLSNLARVEVVKTPTPDLPANMLGGSVNLISRSAFEMKKPQFTYRLAGTWNSVTGGLKYPGTEGGEDFTIGPSLDFSYTKPVNERFGYSVNASVYSRLNINENAESSWELTQFHLDTFEATRSPQWRDAITAGGGLDLKVGENGVLAGKLSYSESGVVADRYGMITQLRGGRGNETFAESIGNRGRLRLQSRADITQNQTWSGSLNFRQRWDQWKFEGNVSYSSSTGKKRALDEGVLAFVDAQHFDVYVRMDEISQKGPASITSRDAAGNSITVTDANAYNLVSAEDWRLNNLAVTSAGRVDATRTLDFAVPVEFKTGVHYSRREKDYRTTRPQYTFLGPDLRANNADNRVGLYDFINPLTSALPGPFGTVSASYLDPYKVAAYFKAHPEQWTPNLTQWHTDRVNGSKQIDETVTAAYVRGDMRLMSNRLWLVGGVRFERTETEGAGPRNDIAATYMRDSNGNVVRAANGTPVRVTTDALRLVQLQFTERGARAHRTYDGFYPNFNATFNLRDDLLVRVAYARTIGRPQFNTIVPGLSISDPDAIDRSVVVSNTGLLPWTAHGYDLSLEWYFTRNSLLSAGVFHKDASNFHGNLVTPTTQALLDEFGLEGDYIDYIFRTTTNVGDAKITGYEFAYRQSLTFLPHWARGLQAFANATFLELEGSSIADFSGYAARDLSWGISLSRPRYTVKLNWSSNGEVRGAAVTPTVSFFTPSRTTLDASFEFRVSPKISIYGTARNLFDRRDRRLRAGADVPDYAQNNRYNEPGVFATLGLKGEF